MLRVPLTVLAKQHGHGSARCILTGGFRKQFPRICSRRGSCHALSCLQAGVRSFQLSARDILHSDFKNKVADCEISEFIRKEAAVAGGGEKANHRHTEVNGKILVRDRIKMLLDEGETFLELSAHAGYKIYNGETVSAAGVLTGIGSINGVRCMIIANDATVKGGTIYPIGLQKQLRAQEVCVEGGVWYSPSSCNLLEVCLATCVLVHAARCVAL